MCVWLVKKFPLRKEAKKVFLLFTFRLVLLEHTPISKISAKNASKSKTRDFLLFQKGQMRTRGNRMFENLHVPLQNQMKLTRFFFYLQNLQQNIFMKNSIFRGFIKIGYKESGRNTVLPDSIIFDVNTSVMMLSQSRILILPRRETYARQTTLKTNYVPMVQIRVVQERITCFLLRFRP